MSYWYQFDSSNMSLIIDVVSPTLKYVWYTQQNVNNTGDPIFYIKKDETIWTIQTISRAEWKSDFKAIWDNRASYSYS